MTRTIKVYWRPQIRRMNTKVALKGMKFYAFHGYYEFERRIGNNYIVDIEAQIELARDPNDQIDETINYEQLYEVVKRYMSKKYKLLESLAYDIAQEVKTTHPKVKEIKVVLHKLNPPVGGKVDKSIIEVTL